MAKVANEDVYKKCIWRPAHLIVYYTVSLENFSYT